MRCALVIRVQTCALPIWLSDEPEDAVVDCQTQTGGQFFQLVLALLAGIQRGACLALCAGRYGNGGAGEADDVVALAILARLHLVGIARLWNPGDRKSTRLNSSH